MRHQPVGHDTDEFAMDLSLMFLVIAFHAVEFRNEGAATTGWSKVSTNTFADVWDDGDDNGKSLRGESEMFRGDVF